MASARANPNRRRIPVLWQECVTCSEWCPCSEAVVPPETCPIRRFGFQTANTGPTPVPQPIRINNRSNAMNSNSPKNPPSRMGFTLTELLVVITIIGILAAMILPALGKVKKQAMEKRAATEMAALATAIKAYESHYSRWPVSVDVMTAAGAGDITYGGMVFGPVVIANPTNSEIMTILMDLDAGVNAGHVKNPQRLVLLTPRTVSDPTQGGVGPDGVYRDPWGTPYVISIDLNFDERCKDVFYCQTLVSQDPSKPAAVGFNGLMNTSGLANDFQLPGTVMVWSAGADRKIDPSIKAIAGVNRDNILSWKQ